MQDYTKYIEDYPIKKENFIKRYVICKNKYVVKLANGQKLSVPKSSKQKSILDKKQLDQINCISEGEVAKIKDKLCSKLNAYRFSLSLVITAVIALYVTNLVTVIFPIIFSLLILSSATYISYAKTKDLYEDIIKNKLIIKDSNIINSLLQIKNLTVRKDLTSLFKGSEKKIVKEFIKSKEKASINYLEPLSLKELLALKKAALKYKQFLDTYANYEEFSKTNNKTKIKRRNKKMTK